MKKVSICICSYNEIDNVYLMYNKITEIMKNISYIDYEIIFADNASTDGTSAALIEIAENDKKVKVILNVKNFGPARSGRNCIFSASGDAIIAIPCDFQEPPEMIPEFLEEWNKGNLVVWGQKIDSKENRMKYRLRSLYYRIIQWCSEYPQYEQTTGFGIMDRTVILQLKEMKEPEKSFRHMVAELGYSVKFIPYKQEARQRGKSSLNLRQSLDFSIKSLVYTSRIPVRFTTLFGVFFTFISAISEIILIILRVVLGEVISLTWIWRILILCLIGLQFLAIGFIGEYIMIILTKITDKPYVIEKERINFER